MAEQGMYVRLTGTDEDESDCGVSCMCNDCYEKYNGLSSDGKYDYYCWEEKLGRDQGTCRECKCDVI